MIERFSKAMGVLWFANNFSPIPSKFSFHMKKKWLFAAQNLQSIKTLLTLELSQYSKSGSIFSSSEPVAAISDCRQLGQLCVCASPSYQRKQSRRADPRAWQLISITFWNSLAEPSESLRDCQRTCRGSNLDSNLNSAAWPTSCKGFIAS